MTTNLLTETVDNIQESGHNENDIIFIGSEETGHSCTWEEFQILANKNYDSGYGAQEVATDLIIVFTDGTKMWRDEYDGAEGWAFSKPFIKPIELLEIKSLFASDDDVGWCSLSDINSKLCQNANQ